MRFIFIQILIDREGGKYYDIINFCFTPVNDGDIFLYVLEVHSMLFCNYKLTLTKSKDHGSC